LEGKWHWVLGSKKKIPKLRVGEDGFWFRGKIIQIFVLWIEHERRKRKHE
jgi:hypothetical protein